MIKLYDLSHSGEWDDIVNTFPNYDVYYLSGYVKAFHIHGDGEPFLLYYEGQGLRAIYVYMKRPTAIKGQYDSVTPYGYGGVLFEGDTSEANLKAFWKAYLDEMAKEHIVDNFVRYHPVLKNAVPMKPISNVIDLGKTIAMDLSSPELIWENIHSKNRNMIRKAEKNGIVIEHGQGMELFDKFIEIYNATMDKDLLLQTSVLRVHPQRPAQQLRYVLRQVGGQDHSHEHHDFRQRQDELPPEWLGHRIPQLGSI